MRGMRQFVTACLALISLFLGTIPALAAAPAVPKAGGVESPYILQVSKTIRNALADELERISIRVDHEYSEALNGFAVSLSDEQISYLSYYFPSIQYSPDRPVTLADSQTGADWNLSTLDQAGASPDTNYKYPSSAGSGIKVYVLDTGVSENLSNFGSRLAAGFDAVDFDSSADCNGHGSHVAGTVGSTKFGVAKQATVVPVRVLGCDGKGSMSDVIAGIDWAIADNPAGKRAVINLSLGSDGIDFTLNSAVTRAVSDGILVVAAAGNSKLDACASSPANSSNSLTVGAIDSSNSLASFSNTGSCVALLAPGVSIQSLDHLDSSANSSRFLSGTSMAAPHVAGAAALYFSLNPTASVATARAALLDNAETAAVSPSGTTNRMLDIQFMNTVAVSKSKPALNPSTVNQAGRPIRGYKITADLGTWTSTNLITSSFQWFECDNEVALPPTSLPALCGSIGGATSQEFTPTINQAGKFLLLEETADNGNGIAKAYSASTLAVANPATVVPASPDATPTNTGVPTISGAASISARLDAADGSWTGSPAPTFMYQWFACNSAAVGGGTAPATGCQLISGATAASFTLDKAQLGKYVQVRVTAKNGIPTADTNVNSFSATSARVEGIPDVTGVSNPSVRINTNSTLDSQGAPRVFPGNSSTLLVENGFWGNSASAITFSYKWFRCVTEKEASKALGSDCDEIASATNATYQVTNFDTGKFVRALVRGQNELGGTNYYTATMLETTSAPVANTATMIGIQGELRVGETISAIAGIWEASPAATLGFQWYSCDSAKTQSQTLPTGCTSIAGAISQSFRLTSTHKGKYLLASVNAKNSASGSAGINSFSRSTSLPVAAAPLLNLTLLGANGGVKFTRATTPELNTKFSINLTGWVSATSYTYKWFRCDEAKSASALAPTGCQELAIKTSTYSVTQGDVGKFVVPFITALSGTSIKETAALASSLVTQQSPVSIAAPAINGTPVAVGYKVTASTGNWLASPAAEFSYQWHACTKSVLAGSVKNSACSLITGATQNEFEISSELSSKFLVVEVKAVSAVNNGSPESSFSGSSGKVLVAPTNTQTPAITYSSTTASGQPIVGSKISIKSGLWSGSPAPTKTVQWYVCLDSVSGFGKITPPGCQALPGQTTTSLTLELAWQGKYLTFAETATNEVASDTIFAQSMNFVQTKPIFEQDPTITGTAKSGQTLTALPNWSALGGEPSASFQWLKCSAAQLAATTVSAGCSDLPVQSSEYLIVTTDLEGSYLVVKVTLENGAGTTVRFSQSTLAVAGEPANLTALKPVSTDGVIRVGTAVNAGASTWTGFPIPSLSYIWYRCDFPVTSKSLEIPSGCSAIPTANLRTYSPTGIDSGKYLSVKTTATQSSLVSAVWSPAAERVFESPSYLTNPTIGSQHVLGGEDISAGLGTVQAFPEVVRTYAWYRCQTETATSLALLPSGCVQIPGQVLRTYEFVAGDVGNYVLASVTVANDAGSSRRFTPTSSAVNSSPSNTSILLPTAGGSILKVGSTLTAGANLWNSLPQPSTYRYQWYRCSEMKVRSEQLQGGCAKIAGASASSYLISIEDSGKYITVSVRADNEYGSGLIFSPSTADVGEDIKFEDEPRLTSERKKGATLQLQALSYRGMPDPARSYRWLRCDSAVSTPSSLFPTNCVAIPKAIGSSYLLAQPDVMKFIAVELKLTNRLGTQLRYTTSSLQIQQTPEITGKLVISGNQWLGKTLKSSAFTVSSFPTAVSSIQWFRDDLPISGAVSDTYTLLEPDVNAFITYRVTATSPAGDSSVSSVPTGPIGMPPRLLLGSLPTVGGLENDSETVAGSDLWGQPGVWESYPESIQFSYQWYLCNLPHAASQGAVPSDCALVKGKNEQDFLVSFKHEGKFVGYSLKVSNGTEDSQWMSSTSARIYVKPKFVTGAKTSFAEGQAAKDGSPRVGYFIEATGGNWRGNATNKYRYEWFSCTKSTKQSLLALKANCEEIYREDGSASNRVFKITSDLAGKFLGVRIIGQYKYDPLTDDSADSNLDEVFTATSVKPVIEPPVNILPPRITSKYSYVQSTVKGFEGTWGGTPKLTQSSTWWSCDVQILFPVTSEPEGCSLIATSSANWKVKFAQENKYLSLAVTSKNAAGETTLWSASTSEVVTTGPVNTAPPKVSVIGAKFPSTLSELSVSDGSWVGDPTPVLDEINWFRCEVEISTASEFRDSSCEQIANAVSSRTYRPVELDAGKFIVAAVTYANQTPKGTNIWVAYSASTSVVNLPPRNLLAPTISQDPFVSRPAQSQSQVTDWAGQPSATLTRQWYVCVSASDLPAISLPSNCSPASKGTGESYIPIVSDLDKYLLLRVTATNLVGEAVAWSNFSKAVVSGPVLITPPTYTFADDFANPVVGARLVTNGGLWQGTPTPSKSFEWLVCDSALAEGSEDPPAPETNCEIIPGASQNTIIPDEAARGKYLSVHVKGSNIHGNSDWYSKTTSVVWMAPVIDQPAEVFGTVFNELNAKAKFDTWKAFPEVTRTYRWYLCSDVSPIAQLQKPISCEEISPAATSSKFKIPASPWLSGRLVVQVSVRNPAGTASIFSATSDLIKPGPINKVPQVISGATNFSISGNFSLTSNEGTWSPESVETNFQWYRCSDVVGVEDELNASCEPIPGANTKTYVLGPDDPGKSVISAVRGQSLVAGELLASTIYSKSTEKITERVNNVQAPAVIGAPKVEDVVTGNDGVWRGFPDPTASIKRAWYVCSSKQAAKVGSKPAGCTILPKTNRKTFAIPDSKNIIGKYLVFSVTQANKIGAIETKVTAFSPSTEPVADPPVLLSKPVLNPPQGSSDEDRPSVGTLWSVSVSWKKPEPTKTYQWYACENRVATGLERILTVPPGCSEISGATASTYTIRLADQSKYLVVASSGSNAAGTLTTYSNSSLDPVDQPPTALPLPVLSGTRTGGQTLSVTSGTWTPPADSLVSPTLISYRWYSCDRAIESLLNEVPSYCDKTDVVSNQYLQSQTFDGGKYITVLVSGKNGKATTNYLLPVTTGTRVGPSIQSGSSKPSLDYDSFLIGNLISVVSGEWSGLPVPTKTYQWYRCLAAVETSLTVMPATSDCTEIPGATEIGYLATSADDGKFLLASETATNGSGSSTFFTPSTDDPMYAGFVPQRLVTVAASTLNISPGSPITISRTDGSWSKPDSATAVLVHRWVYCKTAVSVVTQKFPADCSLMFPIRANRVVAAADTLDNLVLSMDTPFGGYFIGTVEYVQKAGSPPNVDNPANRETFRLSVTTSKVNVAPSLWNSTVTQELHSTAKGLGYQEPVVAPSAPGQLRALVGTPLALSQINLWQTDTDPYSENVLSKVTWRGVDAGTFSYQWFRCDSLVSTLSLTLPAGCSEITGAISPSFTPIESQVNKYLGLKVTATNAVGASSIFTKTTWRVTQKATNVVGQEPSLSTVNQTGISATVAPGDWIGESTPTLGYSWYLCPTRSFTESCVMYPGSGRSFTIVTLGGLNLERYLVAGVTGSNQPYLTSNTTLATTIHKTSAYVSSGRIFESPYWSNGVSGQDATILPITLTAGQTNSLTGLAANVGETLRMEAGVEKWNATPAVEASSISYSWYTCDSRRVGVSREAEPPSDCEVITGQTQNALVLNDSFVGKQIMGRAEAQNAYGIGVSYSPTSPFVAQRPYNIEPPTISFGNENTAVKGSQLTGLPGKWGGSPSGSADANSYRWYLCASAVAAASSLQSGCSLLSVPSNSNNYTPVSFDRGKYIVYSLEVKNFINPAPATASTRHFSAAVGPVLMDPEFAATDPRIQGSAHVGQTLTLPAPNVTSYPEASTSWDWYSCLTATPGQTQSSVPDNCLKEGVSKQTSLVLGETHKGKFITVFATSTSRTQPTKKNAIFSAAVSKEPTNLSSPRISGTSVADGTNRLTVTRGSWDSFPNVSATSFSWYLCSGENLTSAKVRPPSCENAPISGSTSATPNSLLLTREMAGKYLVAAETATQNSNNLGSNLSATQFSISSPVIKSPPAFSSAPIISGTLHSGETLSSSFAKLSAFDADTVSHQWWSCSSPVTSNLILPPASCIEIARGQTDTLGLQESEAGKYITVSVTLSNSLGSLTRYALSSASRVTMTPVNTSAATISGDSTISDSATIKSVAGVWLSNPTASKTYNWYSCASSQPSAGASIPSNCTLIVGAGSVPLSTTSIILKAEFRGRHIVAVEKASSVVNKAGAGEALSVSSSIGPILMAPVLTSNPTTNGLMHDGEVITANLPAVSAFPLNSSTYEWLACDAAVQSTTSGTPTGCASIGRSANEPLTLARSEAGKFILLAATNTNTLGLATRNSISSNRVSSTPVNSAPPTIAGDAVVSGNNSISVSNGTWDSSPTPTAGSFSFVWYSCDSEKLVAPISVPSDCIAIADSNSASLVLTNSMAGKFVIARVTVTVATNKSGSGSTSIFTGGIGKVRSKPLFGNASPTISGIAHNGETLSATLASVSGFDLPTSTYQWWQCSESISAGTADVAGACSVIANSTGSNLQLVEEQVGKRVVVVQTASNSQGSVTRSSASTLIVSSTPSLTQDPTISGSDVFASTAKVSVAGGSWSGTPSPATGTYLYSWFSCSALTASANSQPSGCLPINPVAVTANVSTISLSNNMDGKYLVAKETITTTTNKSGSGVSVRFTAGFGPIKVAPTASADPSVPTSAISTGSRLTANKGTWTSQTQPITYSWIWYSCASAVPTNLSAAPTPNCSAISGYNNTDLVVPSTAANRYILVAVTSTNAGGSSTRTSKSTGKVTAAVSASLSNLRAIF